MVKKELSSVQNWKEAFWETSLCSVNSSHRVTAFPTRSLSLRLFLWNLQSDIWKPWTAMVKKKIYLVKNWKEAFRETALWYVTSTHGVSAVFRRAVCLPYFCGIWELLFRISIKTLGPKEMSSDKNEKETFWETSLWSVNSSHRVTALPSRSRSLRLFLWNL